MRINEDASFCADLQVIPTAVVQFENFVFKAVAGVVGFLFFIFFFLGLLNFVEVLLRFVKLC